MAAITSGVRKFTFSRAVVSLEMRFVLTASMSLTRYSRFSAGNRSLFRRLLIDQQWSRWILEPRRRHHQRARRIRIAALIDPHHVLRVFRIFGKRLRNMDRRADVDQGVEAGRRFAMHSNTAV